MRDFYPDIKPYRQFHLPVGDLHSLYVEESGHVDGVPVVFLHGGPGAGCEPWHRRFFDPARYRIVLFDQRGCGRSTPHAELVENTTQNLVADMERIREELGIERWVVFGGSWGSTLGLAYAEAHPERVLGLILRGIFLCRDQDIRWFYQFGASELFPDHWQDYLEPIPAEERDDLLHAYHRRLTGDDEVARMSAARAWSLWEGRTATLKGSQAVEDFFGAPFVALSLARIECHYFVNQSFLEPGQLLRDAHLLADIPGVIVHGRYDVICPLTQAQALHAAWPTAEFRVIQEAGHSASEPGIRSALIEATDAFATRFA
ncbi:MAG: prolyl aminopeptidase [Gammaproteobacteria bacterium]|jgi:proline iminopeptidase